MKRDLTSPVNVSNVLGAISGTTVTLTWNANTETDLAGYYVYQNGVRRTNSPIQTTSHAFDMADMNAGIEYKFHVTAVDHLGNESGYTDYFVVDKQAPNVPQNVKAVESTDNTSVTLTWDLLADNVYYDIYQNDVKIGRTDNVATYTVTGLTPSTTYNFKVQGVDKSGNIGAFSAVTGVDMATPIVPTALVRVTEAKLEPAQPQSADIGFTWQDQNWRRNITYQTVPTLSNNDIGGSQTTTTVFTFNAPASGQIDITYSIESETNYDFFELLLDGATAFSDSGTKTDVAKTVPYTAGTRTVTLRYRKDGGGDTGLDSVFIKSLKLSNALSGYAFSWTHAEEVDFSHYKVLLDGAFHSNVIAKNVTLSSVAAGTHTLSVQAVDKSGKESAALTHEFTV